MTKKKILKRALLVARSRVVRLEGGEVAFCINLVSWPQYTTTPYLAQSIEIQSLSRRGGYIQSVFFNMQPRRRTCLAESEWTSRLAMVRVPLNV